MTILLYNTGIKLKQYLNDKFVPFDDNEYNYLGLNYPYMCIFVNNLTLNTPALLMLSYDTKMRLQYKYNQFHINKSLLDKIIITKKLVNNIQILISQIDKDLAGVQIFRDKIIASMIKITFLTGIRIGKDIHFKTNNSVGLSTIQKKHIIDITPKICVLEFIGKKGVAHHYEITDQSILKILNYLYSSAKKNDDFIFEFENHKITYIEVNNYIKLYMKDDQITGKDLRTLLANILFIDHFFKHLDLKFKNNIIESTKYVAENLHNTNAVSKKSYIFNRIIEYLEHNQLSNLKTKTPIEILKIILNQDS